MSQRTKGKKKYYLEDWGQKGCCNKEIKENKTVYVDIRFGKEHGELYKPKCPFRSINAAINAIRNIVKTFETQWLIRINPGVYDEIINVPLFVNIVGSGMGVTMLKALHINGTSKISNLSIINNNPSLIMTTLDSEIPAENNILFSNINIKAEQIPDTNNPVISINGRGLNNNVTFENSQITATVKASNPETSNQILFDINGNFRLSNVVTTFIANYKSLTSCFNINDKVIIDGGNFTLLVNDGPAKEVNLFNLISGNLDISNNVSTVSVLILTQEYKADVSFIKSNTPSNIIVTNSTAYLDGVSRDFLNFVDNSSLGAEINLLGLSTPIISVPRMKGIRKNIKYAGISGDGDMVLSGGLYGNIINVNLTTNPDGYILQENDFTIISEGTNVSLFDPALADLVVTDKGKLIFIRNTGNIPIIIDSQNDSIFDGPKTLQPSQAIILQNNSILWYKINN